MTLTRITDVPRLPPRKPDSHKGSYGRVLVFAGRRGMSGAAVLTGSAALRGGAGLVTVACPEDVQPVVAAGNPCYLTFGYANSDLLDGKTIERLKDKLDYEKFDAVAFGPGLGISHPMIHLIHMLALERNDKPLVLDADGLNNLPSTLSDLHERTVPAVLTPHPGEFARLVGKKIDDVQANREALAVEFAADNKVVLLLKGHGTIVTDGSRVYVNETGNPGMATGGCGDVLTGLIAALLGRKLPPFEAACLGAWVQGRAGDLAAEEFGQTALIASDLLTHVGRAFREVESGA